MGIFNRLKNIVKSNNSLEAEKRMEKKTLFNLKLGDMVCIEELDYEIEGIIHFTCDGWKWIEYKLKDAFDVKWLSVEMDDEIEIGLYEEIKRPEVEVGKNFIYENVKYNLDEGGVAVVEKCEGLGIKVGTEVRFMEYCDRNEEKYFSVETWGLEKEYSVGRDIKEYNVEIYG
ncbi:MAG: DUF4178 domain-containing protein [Clostridium sp.]|uniref:DUF4178 domain-containing protein n=1 Tax=Clostridium sp. TaxID=1506 RepID=UPI003F3C994B